MRRLMVLVPVLLFAVTACGSAEQRPPATPDTTPTTPSPASPAPPAKPTLADLAKAPCQALTEADRTRLGVFVDGTEMPDSAGKTCYWSTYGATVSFTPFPTLDRTKTDAKDLTSATIDGHRAKLGQLSHGGDTGYFVFVAVGTGSFQLATVAAGANTDPAAAGKDFAKAIVNRLE